MDQDQQEQLDRALRWWQTVCELEVLDKARGLMVKYEVSPSMLDVLRTELQTKRDYLVDALYDEVSCDACHGSGAEGHGETCGQCGGDGTIPIWLHLGVPPPATKREQDSA